MNEANGGAELGLGVCPQPDGNCNCNAHVYTDVPGCYRIAAPPASLTGGPQELYFLHVADVPCIDSADDGSDADSDDDSDAGSDDGSGIIHVLFL